MAERRLNVVALVIILLVIVLSIPVAYGVHKLQVKRNAYNELSLAEEAIAKGDDKAAVSHLNKYIHFYPDDPAAYLKFAEISARQANNNINILEIQKQALDAQEKALRFPENREHVEIVRNLADLCKRTRRFDDAIKHYTALAKDYQNDMKMFLDMADCKAAINKHRDAVDDLSMIIQRDPTYLQAYLRSAEIYAENMSNLKDAKVILDKMTDSNSRSAEAYALKARFLAEHEDIDSAKKELANAIGLDPNDKETLVTNVSIAMVDKRYADADTALATFQKLFPDDERGLNMRMQLELQRDRPEKAEQYARENAQKEDSSAIDKFKLLDILIKSGKIQDAKNYLEELRKKNYPGFMLEYFDGQISLYKKEWRDAVIHFNKARLDMQNFPELRAQTQVYLGICYEQLEQYDLQLEMFGEALKEIPQSTRARTGYALALFHLGRKAEAREQLVKVKDQVGEEKFLADNRLRAIFYQLELARQQTLPEDQRSEAVLKMFADNDTGEVKMDDPIQVLARCEVLVKDRRFDDAQQLLKQALRENSKQASYWSALSMVAILQNNLEQAKEYIAQGKKEVGYSTALLNVELKEILAEGKVGAASKVDAILKEVNLLPVEQKVSALKSISEMYVVLNEFSKAQDTLQQLYDLNPDNTNILLRKFLLARAANDEQLINSLLEKIKNVIGEKTGEYQFATAAQIVWQVRNQKLKKDSLLRAKDLLKVAYQARTNWIEIPMLQYEIAILENSNTDAIAALNRMRQLGNLTPKQNSQLVYLLFKEGRMDEAKAILNGMGRIQDPKLNRLKVSIEATSGDINDAFETAERIARDSDNSLELLWFGQIALKAGKLDEAYNALKKAIQIDPKNVDAALALITVMKEKKDFSEIDSLIDSMDNQYEGENLALAKAEAMKIKGDAPRTYELYKEALEKYPHSLPLLYGMSQFLLQTTRPDAAMPFLQKIMQLNDENPDPNKMRLHWARRNFVRLLLSLNYNMENQAEGIKLLDANIAESETPSLEDVKMKAIILVSCNNPRDRAKAINLMEGIIKRGVKLEPEEQFILGRLYNEAGKWEAAREQMQDLCVREPNNIRYITEFIRMMLRRNLPVEEVQPYITRLEQNFPKTIISVLLRSEMLHIQDKDAQAADMLMNYFKSISDDHLEELPIVARQLNRIGQVEKAEEAFKVCMQKTPKGALDYADFLSRRRRIDEAINLLESLKDNPQYKSGDILKALLDLLRVSPRQPTAQQLQRVSQILGDYQNKFPNDISILVQIAELRMLEGKVDEAEKIYEDILKMKSITDWQRVVIYNNLAYALAISGKSPQKALDVINEAIKIHGPAEYLLDTRALTLLAFDDKDPAKLTLAVSDLERAVAKNPTAIYYFHLARAYMANDDRENAKATMDICRNQYEMTINDVPKLERGEYGRVLTSL